MNNDDRNLLQALVEKKQKWKATVVVARTNEFGEYEGFLIESPLDARFFKDQVVLGMNRLVDARKTLQNIYESGLFTKVRTSRVVRFVKCPGYMDLFDYGVTETGSIYRIARYRRLDYLHNFLSRDFDTVGLSL